MTARHSWPTRVIPAQASLPIIPCMAEGAILEHKCKQTLKPRVIDVHRDAWLRYAYLVYRYIVLNHL